MKRHIKSVILFLLLLALIPGMLFAVEAMLPSFYRDTYYARLSAMYDRLYAAEGKKIVIVGGSNVAFGVNTVLLEQLLAEKGFDYSVCSFGLYGAVGASAMLELSQDALTEGDLVILAVEPSSETMSSYFGATAFWKCAEDAPELIWHLSRQKQNALLGNYLSFLQERMEIFASGIWPKAEGAYTNASFDDRCNMIYPREGNQMPLGYDTAATVDFSAVVIEKMFAEQVNDYCRDAEKQGAQVCLSFSPVNRSALTGDEEAVEVFFRQCTEIFRCPVISDPNAYILDSGWFYDSNFHLNTAGAQVRTILLAEDILAWLSCYEPPDHELPQMPHATVTVWEGETDTLDFLFEPVIDSDHNILGYSVSELTESGLRKAELTVPVAYQNKPVIGVKDDAFRDAAALETLRLPETIESLPDAVFQNCTSLTQLILEHKDRLCAITKSTFDGADQVKIYVPSDAYAMYRDGDGCETNLWSLYLERIHPYD